MPVFNAQEVFTDITGTRIVTVQTNGGDVTVAARHGDTPADPFIDDQVINTDGVYEVDFSGPDVRFTPTGGCTYAFQKRK